MEENDNYVRGMEELLNMFMDLCLSNSDKMYNSFLSTLKNNGQILVDFCSKFKYVDLFMYWEMIFMLRFMFWMSRGCQVTNMLHVIRVNHH